MNHSNVVSALRFPIFAALAWAVAAIAAPAQAQSCPPGQFVLDARSCQVCQLPGALRRTGATAGPDGAACYVCEGGEPANLLSCREYWDTALDATELVRHERLYRNIARHWLRSLDKGKPGKADLHGKRFLEHMYRDSEAGAFASQTNALELIAALSHFATQLNLEGPWPALETTVSFVQLDWLAEPGVAAIPNSHVARVVISPGVLDTRLLRENDGGWFNLVIRPAVFPPPFRSGMPAPGPDPVEEHDWRVRNLLLSFADAADQALGVVGVLFGLGTPDGERVEEVEFAVLIDEEPIPFDIVMIEVPDEHELQFDLVELDGHLVGGLDDGEGIGGGSDLVVPDDIEVWDGCPGVDTDPGGCIPDPEPPSYGSLPQPHSVPVVNEFDDHCVPGAVARGLKILWGDSLPSAQLIMEEIRIDMGTNGASEGGAESGTYTDDILPGKAAYVSRHGLVGTTTSRADDGPLASDVDRAIATLRAGGVVEVLISYDAGGGHMALVTDIFKKPNGEVQIYYVDDNPQGDNNASNVVDGMLIDANGKFSIGTVDGFILETRE